MSVLDLMVCPHDHGHLVGLDSAGQPVARQDAITFRCDTCGKIFDVVNSIPVLLPKDAQ